MSFDPDKLQAAAQLGEVIRLHNEALEKLREFRRNRPYALPPNMAIMVEENLKENVQILYKELNHQHKPMAERRRHVCRLCHHVFATTLPGGLCDECRSRPAGQPAAYGMWPVTPESETATAFDVTPDPTAAEVVTARIEPQLQEADELEQKAPTSDLTNQDTRP